MESNLAFKADVLSKEHLKHLRFLDSGFRDGLLRNPKGQCVQSFQDERLKVGFIGDDEIYKDLGHALNLFPLLQNQWKLVIKWADLDFVLVQSCYKSFFGDWAFYQVPESDANNEIKQLLRFCSLHQMRIVFIDCCQDELNAQFLKSQEENDWFSYFKVGGKKTVDNDSVLTWCEEFYNEKLYNPFLLRQGAEDFDQLRVVFEKFCLLESSDILLEIFDRLSAIDVIDVSIFERGDSVYESRAKRIPYYEKMVGCLSGHQKLDSFSGKDIWLDFVDCEDRLYEIKKRALEAAGCKVFPVVFDPYGVLNDELQFGKVCTSTDDLLAFLYAVSRDRVYLDRLQHLAWRKAVTSNTVSKFLNVVVEQIGVEEKNKGNLSPKVSVVVPTIRPEMLEGLIKKFDDFLYEEKDLIIVTHGFEADLEFRDLIKGRSDILLYSMPANITVGACLNLGVKVSDADYIMRMDDDDIYGRYYISDSVLQLQSSISDFMVKPRSPIKFTDDDSVFVRESALPMRSCTGEDLKKYKVLFGGNSFFGKRLFFVENPFFENIYGACDTATLRSLKSPEGYRFCVGDQFNLVAVRNPSGRGHTWGATGKEIKDKSLKLDYDLEKFFV